MKQVYKNYLFSNFGNDCYKSILEKNKLFSTQSFNVKIDGQNIKSSKGVEDYFMQKFNNLAEYSIFFNQNKEILQKIIYLTDYEYIEEFSQNEKVRYFCFDADFMLYEIDFTAKTIKKLDVKFNDMPRIFKQDGYLYFYCNEGVYIIKQKNNPQFFDDVFDIKDYIYYDDKICLVSQKYPNSMFVCERTELINLTSALECYQRIDFNLNDGAILKIVKFKDEIVVFQQYKVLKYDIYATKNQIAFEFELTTKIIDKTISLINDKIIFLTESGLKIFDGNNIENALSEISDKIDMMFEKMFSISFDSKYYLNSKLLIGEDYKNVLVVFDIENSQVEFLNFYCAILNAAVLKNMQEYNMLLFCDNGENKVYINNSKNCDFSKYVKFNKIYFDTEKIKQITSVKFTAKGSFLFRIKSDIDEREIFVSDNMKDFVLNLKGHIFGFEIECLHCFDLEAIFVEVMTIEDNL